MAGMLQSMKPVATTGNVSPSAKTASGQIPIQTGTIAGDVGTIVQNGQTASKGNVQGKPVCPVKHFVKACVKIFRLIISTAGPAGGYVPEVIVSTPNAIIMGRARQDGPTVTRTGTARTLLRVRTGTTADPVTACVGRTKSVLRGNACSAVRRDMASATRLVITS